MSKLKRGYTLIELIVTISIIMILSSIALSLIISAVNDYLACSENCFQQDIFDNAMLNIDSLCNKSNIVYIDNDGTVNEISTDNITIKYEDEINSGDFTLKTIYLNKNKLMVKSTVYMNGKVSKGNNVLLNDVKNFKVIKKGNLIYYTITTDKAGERSLCI